MYIRNTTIAVIFRVLFIIVCGAGLLLTLLETGVSLNVILGDFALIVSVLALIYFAYLIIARPDYDRGALRGAVTIYMLVVFAIYYLTYFDAPAGSLPQLSLAKYLLYFAAPLMAFADYLLFCRKGDFTSHSPLFWVIIPILFNLAVFLVNKFVALPVGIVYFNLFGMGLVVTLLVFLGASYLLFVVDNLLAGRRG